MTEFQLNCSIASNPLPSIFWLFKKIDNSENKKLKEAVKDNKWEYLNLQASYSIKHSSSSDRNSLKKFSLSKYDIVEKHLKSNFIVSSLLIKVFFFINCHS